MKKILTRFRETPGSKLHDPDNRNPIYVMLENIRSLYNVGSVFRTSDAARIQELLLCGITGYPPRKEISKTALGAENSVPFRQSSDPHPVLDDLQQNHVQLIAVEHTEQSRSIWEIDLSFPVCFVFGYEIEGISQPTLDRCDQAIEIPMFGQKGSLNVSVACGIVLYEALRRLNSRT